MAEPSGVAFKIKLGEAALNQALRSRQAATENLLELDEALWRQSYQTAPAQRVSQFFAELLDRCNDADGSIFLCHDDAEKQSLFFCYAVAENGWRYANALLSIARQLSGFQDGGLENGSPGAAALYFSPVSRDVFKVFWMQQGVAVALDNVAAGRGKVGLKGDFAAPWLDDYLAEIWGRQDPRSGGFASPDAAVRKKDYFYAPVVLAYRRRRKQMAAQQRPQKIKQATAAHPFFLFDYVYSWDEQVFVKMGRRPRLVAGADPYTLRKVGDLMADAVHVFDWQGKAQGYAPLAGVDGASFEGLGDADGWMYYRDKAQVYCGRGYLSNPQARKQGPAVVRMPQADVQTFEYLGFAYGKDKNHVYCREKTIPIDPATCRIDRHGFLRDAAQVFHDGRALGMEGASFRVVQYGCETNPFSGVFILEDRNGQREYDSRGG